MANTVHIVNIPQLLFEKACAAKYELNTAQTKLNFFDARKFCMIIILLSNGTPCRIRTCDPRLRRPMLYPAELRALNVIIPVKNLFYKHIIKLLGTANKCCAFTKLL